jgi:hypothetical protein
MKGSSLAWPCTNSSQPEQKPPKPGHEAARLAEVLPRKPPAAATCPRYADTTPLRPTDRPHNPPSNP